MNQPPYIKQVVVVDYEVIKLVFSEEVVLTDLAYELSSYQISPLDGGHAVDVKQVIAWERQSNFYCLQVSPPQKGKKYNLTVVESLVRGLIGDVSYLQSVWWEQILTKADNSFIKLPEYCNIQLGSVFRVLFQAISSSDERIGGSAELPIFTISGIGIGGNWGGVNWGGGNWGG